MRWWVKWIAMKEAKGMLNDLLKLEFLRGRRTQLAAIAVAVLTLLLQLGVITQEQYNTFVGLLTSVGLLTAAAHKDT